MRIRKMWTEEDLRVLKEEYSSCCTKDLCNRLGRKKGNLHNKAMKMGLKKSADLWEVIKAHRKEDPPQNPKCTGTLWTKEQAEMISANKGNTREELALLLGTTAKNLSRVIFQFRKRGWLPPFERKAKIKVAKIPKRKTRKPVKKKPTKVKKVKRKGSEKQKPTKALAQPAGNAKKRIITSAVRTMKAHSSTTPDKPEVRIFNRDLGRVRVQVDSRTWKYVTPEKAEQFKKDTL